MSGETIGYMGLAYINWENKYGEADAIVKIKDVEKGLMTKALKTMIQWARIQLGLKDIGVRVLSDNPALEFYRKCGFNKIKKVPLTKHNKNQKIIWCEDPDNGNPERFLIYHIYDERL
jgi:RimJ/RimL family protein N-acetyltransferase